MASRKTRPRARARKAGSSQSKLTAALIAALCEKLKRGHYEHSAAAFVTIHPKTLSKWKRRGLDARARHEETGEPVPVTERLYVKLVEDVEFALAYGEAWLMEQALTAMENPKQGQRWQGYVTILERSRPDRWRRRSAAEYLDRDRDKGKRSPLNVDNLSRDERQQFRDLLAKMRGDDGS